MNLVWLIPAVLAPGAAMTARTLSRQHQAATAAARRERVQQQRAQRDDTRLAAVLDQWADDMRQEEQ